MNRLIGLLKKHVETIIFCLLILLLATPLAPSILSSMLMEEISSSAMKSLSIVVVLAFFIERLAKMASPNTDSSTNPQDAKHLGPFLCKPSTTSMGFWFHSNKDIKNVYIKRTGATDTDPLFKVQHIKYNIWMCELEDLSPGTTYKYKFFIDDKEYIPEWLDSREFSFTTFSEEKDQSTQFFTMSCHGLEEFQKKHPDQDAWAMWNSLDMVTQETKSKIEFGVLGGDQVYMDDTFNDKIENFESHASKAPDLIREIYYKYWSAPAYQRVLNRVPTILMWDDHDLIDGFGSRPDAYTQNGIWKESWLLYKTYLREAFFAFQAIRNPETTNISENFSNRLDHPKASIVSLDLRSERDIRSNLLLSKKSKSAVEDLIATRKSDNLFILTPVTIARIAGPIENAIGQISNALWHLTSWVKYGPSLRKVFLWDLVFILFFLATQLPDNNTNSILKGAMIALVSFSLFGYSKLKKKKDIKGQLSSLIDGGLIALFLIGSIAVFCGFKNAEMAFDIQTAWSGINNFLRDESENLSLLGWATLTSQVLIFKMETLEKFRYKPLYKSVAYALAAFSFIIFMWYGLPGKQISFSLVWQVPLSLCSMMFLTLSYLESFKVIDLLAGLDDDIKDAWSAEDNHQELDWLMNLLRPMKNPPVVLSGDIHTGGLTNLVIDNKVIPQVVASPIAYPPMEAIAEKLTSGSKAIPFQLSTKSMNAENIFYICKRNFAVITINSDNQKDVEFYFEGQTKNIKIDL